MKFKVIYFEKNMGHGESRNASIQAAENELIAMMDSDDIAAEERFEKELQVHIEENVSVVGGQITEFEGSPDNIVGIRAVPEKNEEIYAYLKKRCPFNHMTVMFKKSEVMSVGGYQDWYCDEDYFLWIRMAEKKKKFKNLPDVLVNVRVGEQMYRRRGGWNYFRSEQKLHYYMKQKKMLTLLQYLVNVGLRFVAQVLCPNVFRKYLFRLTRKKQIEVRNKTAEKHMLYRYPKFSVAMSVYNGDNPEHFDIALASIINQTIPPDEIVLVVDGPINQKLQKIIEKYQISLTAFTEKRVHE